MYGVWCEVSGGVTGHRQAWLKHNGKRAEFATREEAEAEARHYQQRTDEGREAANARGVPSCEFRYTAREIGAATGLAPA